MNGLEVATPERAFKPDGIFSVIRLDGVRDGTGSDVKFFMALY
jgi:hypothetical protein